MADELEFEAMAGYLERLQSHFQAALVPQAMRGAVEIIHRGHEENFATESNPDGRPWVPRKPPTGIWPILRKTGALANAATGFGGGAIAESTDTSATVGVDKGVQDGGIPAAAAHNFGYPERNLPQREWLGVGENYIDEIEEGIVAELEAEMP